MRKRNSKSGIAAALVLAFLIIGLSVQPGELQSGICEEAFLACMDDWYNQAWGYIGTIYCAMGWAFCKKYVDPS